MCERRGRGERERVVALKIALLLYGMVLREDELCFKFEIWGFVKNVLRQCDARTHNVCRIVFLISVCYILMTGYTQTCNVHKLSTHSFEVYRNKNSHT